MLRRDCFEEFRESVVLARDRLDDNAAGFRAHVHGIIQAELGGREDSGRNAHRSTVAPFLADGFHRRSPPPCRNIVSTAVIKLKAEIWIRFSFPRHSSLATVFFSPLATALHIRWASAGFRR